MNQIEPVISMGPDPRSADLDRNLGHGGCSIAIFQKNLPRILQDRPPSFDFLLFAAAH